MRIGLGLASLALATVLLLGFKAPQDAATTGSGTTGSGTTGSGAAGTGSGSTSGGSTSGGSTSSGAAVPGPTAAGSTSNGSGSTTVDGPLVDTRYGPVQVEVTLTSGKVTSVTAIELPSGGRSGAISQYAAPILSSEALAAQSAQIDLVSGATYTSEGYSQSLQSALNQAGL